MQKVALITGTGKGIGKAIAKILLEQDYLVFGYSRSNNISHPNFTFHKIDLSNLDEVQKIELPKINCNNVLLINNAGTIGSIVPFNLKTENDIIAEYNLNIISPTLLSKRFLNSYKNEKKLLINISSGAANKAIVSWSTYCASKSALDRLTEVIAEEKHKNLTVFSVHPGVVDTNMQAEIRNSDPKNFPLLSKFTDYYIQNELFSTKSVAIKLHQIISIGNCLRINVWVNGLLTY